MVMKILKYTAVIVLGILLGFGEGMLNQYFGDQAAKFLAD